ncbi:hypothetical protein OEZ85_005884 [Tetradesmus obliquus]|uniref:Uncharacterized protein n=1 Tax=Tetradesmus obliquus TaxID=3088 RepID=A0ABY8UG34_TETOB|nr:hypothetical protein OEZ85_005884 [Tetradesmus obliquus]
MKHIIIVTLLLVFAAASGAAAAGVQSSSDAQLGTQQVLPALDLPVGSSTAVPPAVAAPQVPYLKAVSEKESHAPLLVHKQSQRMRQAIWSSPMDIQHAAQPEQPQAEHEDELLVEQQQQQQQQQSEAGMSPMSER